MSEQLSADEQFTAQFEPPEDQVEETEVPEETEQTQEPDSEEPEEQAAETPEGIEVAGRRYAAADLEPIVAFAEWAADDPDRWAQLQAWAQGQPLQPTPQDQRDEDEWVDPQVAELRANYAQLQARLDAQESRQHRSAVDEATAQFSQARNLDDERTNTVLSVAARYKLVEAVRQQYPNLSGTEVVRKALDDAYKIAFFDQGQRTGRAAAVADMRKRRRAAASSATSVSTPRTDPEPKTPDERHSAFIAEIEAAMGDS